MMEVGLGSTDGEDVLERGSGEEAMWLGSCDAQEKGVVRPRRMVWRAKEEGARMQLFPLNGGQSQHCERAARSEDPVVSTQIANEEFILCILFTNGENSLLCCLVRVDLPKQAFFRLARILGQLIKRVLVPANEQIDDV